jgi:hypothetical protein
MSERQVKRERTGGRGPNPGIWDAQDPSGQMATVTHGPYAEQLPVAGLTVAQIRTRFRDRFDLDPAATAVIDGNDASEDTTLRAGQLLMFMRRAGEKGGRSWRSS